MDHRLSSGQRAAVTTMLLTAEERARVDAAGEGLYRALHRDSADDVIRDIREQRARVVVVSVSRCDERSAARVARMVHEFPRVPTVALLTRVDGPVGQAVLSLGRSGVRTLVDVRQPAGWRELRDTLAAGRGDGDVGRELAAVRADLADAPADCRRFFEQLFLVPASVGTVRQLATVLDVLPSTMMSRFFRSGLPAPKRYLAMARLVRAARRFENPGLSIANVSNELDYSSAQSFGRHVRTWLHMTAAAFRERYDGDGMLLRFRTELILPYLATLNTFRPLTVPPGWTGRAS